MFLISLKKINNKFKMQKLLLTKILYDEIQNNIKNFPQNSSLGNNRIQNHYKNRRETKRRRCEFIEDEAEGSGNDSSDHEDTYDDGLSQFVVDSIIADHETGDHSSINMQAKYLESVRSPTKIRGGFKIPEHRQYMDMSKICSQPVVEESLSAYKEDSFVVTDEEDIVDGEVSQICPLERAEAILKARRKAKKKRLNFNNVQENSKQSRWKKLIIESSGDEES